MALRRGFKADANRTARELREELGLAADDPLCSYRLAAHLEVPVLRLSSFLSQRRAETTYLLSGQGQKDFSAVTLCFGANRAIVFNDGHSLGRQSADIAHELSHMLLHHPPHHLRTATGRRHFDADLEEEANCLGPTLLVSDEAAVAIVRQGLNLNEAAQRYGVSTDLVRMRLNLAGAYKRVKRAA